MKKARVIEWGSGFHNIRNHFEVDDKVGEPFTVKDADPNHPCLNVFNIELPDGYEVKCYIDGYMEEESYEIEHGDAHIHITRSYIDRGYVEAEEYTGLVVTNVHFKIVD